jgi:ribosomal-protein-alanine N-acetyltransferase
MLQELETEHLILRRFHEGDVQALYLLGSIPAITRYTQSRPFASLDEARALMVAAPFHDYATHGYGRFACVWKATGAVIGFSGVKYVPEFDDNELGYRFLPEYWGRGLATEAGQASIDFARSSVGLSRLIALVHPDNTASARVVTKLGFAVEKQVRYSGLPGVDLNLYARSL